MNEYTLKHLPSETLERRAEEQRVGIDESLNDLKISVRESIRKHLDVNSFARHRVSKLAALASALALATGYAVAGMFTRH